MKDDAVAPVIAVMLILAALVTFLSLWNAVYVPSMKQAAEVSHLQNVESAFMHFSSDIERAASTRQDGLTLSEPVQLGGGDFFFNTLRSSGSLWIRDEQKPAYYLGLYDLSGAGVGEIDGTLVNISYEPQGNFWQDQGYRWQYGYLNATKHRTLQSPLRHYNMTSVDNEFWGTGSLATFAGSFGSVEFAINQTHLPDTDSGGTVVSYSPRAGNCSNIILRAVNLSASPEHPFVSSNGFGTLQLKTNVSTVPYYDIQKITIGSGGYPFGNATFSGWNSSLSDLNTTYCKNSVILIEHDDGFSSYEINQEISPVNITLQIVNIEVTAY
ncbi:MAG: hypothetical protein PHT99_02890 [Methanoregula sp.]|nr:hypothetical protein [Methanoregula sp.]